ncbi:hypothetical protein SAMN02745150_00262 [Brevinema andersonii]|uniref:Lipocalin-like domain-containing protein n=1 Tax=Brevinema andersonii TaxID=34097 RepID=A0A1I1D2T2_BREAD|nr:hypothetical protein [Brevinema andersonii]SFB69319.1 hypothetical protein SAMN02745150_00262 [Brevinema andersonii]
MRKSITLIMLASCSVLPPNYQQMLIGSWSSIETINISGGDTDNIIYNSTYAADGSYRIEVNHPVQGIKISNFIYKTGYLSPHPSITLLDPTTFQAASLPIYYYFSNNMLVTSTNSNFRLDRIWTRVP